MRIMLILMLLGVVAGLSRPWMDATLPVAKRVDLILAEMTDEEKVNQLLHVWIKVHDTDVEREFGATGVGAMYLQVLSNDTACNQNASCRLAARNALQQSVVSSSRLGIPITFVAESIHTAYTATQSEPGQTVLATVFPMPVNLGSSWNRTLVEEVAAVVAREGRALGADRGFSPELQVTVDPRFGRGQENFGADPLLVSELGVAGVHGLAGPASTDPDVSTPNTYLAQDKLVSQAKHFAAYGFGDHDGAPADVSTPTLYDVYLKPWRAYIKAGGRGAMAAHNSINNQPCHTSKWLLTSILREELGCKDCFVGTDYNDIANIIVAGTANATKYPGMDRDTDPSIQALEAGIDQDMGGVAFKSLLAAASHTPPLYNHSHLDRAAGNVLRAKFAAGLFDTPTTDPTKLQTVHNAASLSTAYQAAAQSLVLLQNPNNSVLPLSVNTKHIALLGPNAGCSDGRTICDVSANMLGGYVPVIAPGQVLTVLDALLQRNASSTTHFTTTHSPGVDIDSYDVSRIGDAVEATKEADAVVIVVGDDLNTCGESDDRMELDLPGEQLELVHQVLQANAAKEKPVPIVLVLIAGRPSTFGAGRHSKYGKYNAMLNDPNLAVLEAWRPGEQGGPAIVDTLFGNRQPDGRLTQPFPKSAGYVHSWTTPWFHLRQEDYDAGAPYHLVDSLSYAPIYCFGHGLAYNTFALSNMVVSEYDPTSKAFKVTVTVTEEGAYAGPPAGFVMQIYFLQVSASKQVRNALMLGGFEKVVAGRGTPTEVTVSVRAEDMGYTVWDGDTNAHSLVTEEGEYRFFACRSACDCALNATVTMPHI